MEDGTSTSPLLSLPAEIRNQIYFDAVVSDQPIEMAEKRAGPPIRLNALLNGIHAKGLSLVCAVSNNGSFKKGEIWQKFTWACSDHFAARNIEDEPHLLKKQSRLHRRIKFPNV
jgi:hypothetical protein